MKTRIYIAALVLICCAFPAWSRQRETPVLWGDVFFPGPISPDLTNIGKAPAYIPPAAGLIVNVTAYCEDDAALESAIKSIAEGCLLRLGGVSVSDVLEESSVMVSFVAFRERNSAGMLTGRIVYSFAYGAPDIAEAENVPVALPRYLYHQPELATRETLEGKIEADINTADRDFFRFLRLQ